jgi:hypothetical protein
MADISYVVTLHRPISIRQDAPISVLARIAPPIRTNTSAVTRALDLSLFPAVFLLEPSSAMTACIIALVDSVQVLS